MKMHSLSLIVVEKGFDHIYNRLEEVVRKLDLNTDINNNDNCYDNRNGNSNSLSSRSSLSSKLKDDKHTLTTSTIRLLCQITSDSTALAKACRTFGGELIRRSLDEKDRLELKRLTKVEQRFNGLSTDAQVRMHQDMTEHIDALMSACVDDGMEWSATTVRGYARPGMNIVVERLEELLSFSNDLNKEHRTLTHIVAMRHICEKMVQEFENAACTERKDGLSSSTSHHITVPAICNFSSDIALLEAFSETCYGINNLKEMFAEPRQLCNLLLSEDIESILDDDIRMALYPSVKVDLLVRVLKRYKPVVNTTENGTAASKLKSMMSNLLKRKKNDTKTNRNHCDTIDSDIGDEGIITLSYMTKKEADTLAKKVEQKLLQHGKHGKHG
jgi:hypothetical protein